jgi:hypothetical protein
LGTDRLEWQRDALKHRDHELEAINQRFREPVFDACWQLIDRFASVRIDRAGGSGQHAV